MSYTAIGAVTQSIAELLGRKLNKPPLMGSSTPKVTTLPPDDDRVDDNDGVNLFLYRVTEDPHNRNNKWPGDKSHQGSRRSALSLNLHYLVTGYAKKSDGGAQEGITAHQLLGNAMAIFHAHPVLNEIHDADFDADLNTQFPHELRDSFEKIKITLMPNSMEEFSKIWNGVNKGYRLSVIYEVSLIQIAPMMPTRGPSPAVQQVGLDVSPFGAPVIDSINPPRGPAGSEVTIRGKGFRVRGASTSVMIDDLTLSEPDLTKLQDDEIILTVPEALQRGPGLHLSVVAGARQSQSQIYEVSPWILSPQPLRGFTGVPLTIPFQVPTGATLGVEIDGQPAAFTIDVQEKVVRAIVPASIASNGPKTVRLIVNDGVSVRSNARFFEVLPMIQEVTIERTTTPDKTTITVTGQRLKGADVNVKYGKLLLHKGENTSETEVVVEISRLLLDGLPTSVMVDGRESNVLPPHLDVIDPSQAFAGDEITLKGAGLSGQTVSVSFGAAQVNLSPQAASSLLKVRVPPALAAGTVPVKATVNNKDTNTLTLLVLG